MSSATIWAPPEATRLARLPELSARPLVSVAITNYNYGPYLQEAVGSLLAQSYTNYEVIVINDGSPDSVLLEKAIAPYRSRVTYLVQENRGPSAATRRLPK